VKAAQAAADSHFDLSIIRLSLLVDIFGYIGMAFLVPAPVFVLLTCLVSFGSCAGPAGNSLALNLIDSSRDAGRLFGGLSVVQAMSSAFLGPLVFSLVFAKTVGTYSPTVFGVAVIVLVIAQIFLSFIRLPRVTYKVDTERGRPRRTKRVKSSSMSQGGSP
jgi:MFS family permease